jgi:AcrR family transcriptional regulator
MDAIVAETMSREYSHMKRTRADSLSPRKQPRQRRSRVTIDTIFEATIQVLLANGLDNITTIQIAARAGVSVGSLYQYFPNKRALLAAVVGRHVGDVVDATIAACASAHGRSVAEMCATMMHAFVEAKTRRPDVSRALYLPTAMVNADAIVKQESARCARAVHDMLITASDATFAQAQEVSAVLVASIVGPTRAAIEGQAGRDAFDRLTHHLTALGVGYLKEMATTATAHSRDGPSTGNGQAAC